MGCKNTKISRLPIYEGLVEDIIGKRIVDFGHQSALHTAKISRTGIVGITREGLLKVLILIKLVGEAHPDRNGKPVHGGGFVALDGHGRNRIGDYLPINLIIALSADDGQGSLPLDFVFQSSCKGLAQGGVNQRGVVREGVDSHGLGTGVYRTARE